jgi:hypothetical protein
VASAGAKSRDFFKVSLLGFVKNRGQIISRIVRMSRDARCTISSQYHKSRDFQDNSANLEFFGG